MNIMQYFLYPFYALSWRALTGRLSHHQTQPLQLAAVFQASSHNINPRGIDAAVAQHVRQLRDVFFYGVKGPGKKLAQIVGKDLAGLDPGGGAQALHPPPDAAAA